MITLTHEGKTLTLNEWAKITGLSRQAIYQRMNTGHPPEVCLGYKPWEKPSKNEQEMKFNDIPLDQLPNELKKLVEKAGYAGKRYGTFLRSRCRADFDKWFEGLSA
jgi:hypothetical protein